jgi:prenyltransferase beta subunit
MAWPSNGRSRTLRRSFAALTVSVLAIALASPGPAGAKPNDATNEKRLESTVRYLQDVQNLDGGFSGEAGGESGQDFSAWVALALAADGINPRAQAQQGDASAYTYLVDHAARALREECEAAVCTTGFERELLVVDAAGTSPQDFGGFDLVTEILSRQLPDGSFPHTPGGRGAINDTVFAILSLSLVHEPTVQAAVHSAAEWLIGQQNSDGGWSWENKEDPSESDLTGAAIEALNAAGTKHTEAQTNGLRFLHEVQDPDGGFPELTGEHESNVASTAWATQGLWAAGENPETWLQGTGEEPLDYMASMQQPDGHIRYRASEESNGVWMTAYVAPAFAGQPLPIPPVPYEGKAPETTDPPPSEPTSGSAPPSSPGTVEPGVGGESSQPGTGVIAGGAGDRAPLFSRPQPQSRGHAPGGVRLLDSRRKRGDEMRTTAKKRRNPGSPRKTSAPTVTRSAAKRSGAHGRTGAGSAPTGAGSSRSGGSGGVSLQTGRPDAGEQASGHDVSGVLIGAPSDTGNPNALEPGAPGLHSAGAGGNQTPWLAMGIAFAATLIAAGGSLFERRRPQVLL